MSKPKKYTMRPTRKKPDGTLQMVPIGFIKGHKSGLSAEGEHEVNSHIHRAWLNGDIDIDDYPHERPAQGGPKAVPPAAKKADKKAKKSPKKSETPKPSAKSDAKTDTDKES